MAAAERLLERWARALGTDVRRGHDGRSPRAGGGHAPVRRLIVRGLATDTGTGREGDWGA
ncbi:hypothetical protein GCM10010300_48130 [Streptomyces olivaceoviridis]|nr:hypothetical protein GCM10010300_48130 [Streptomyces olivaceoviridis]